MCEFLYEHGPCLVVNKPPGVLTQAPVGIDSVEVQVKSYLARRDRLNDPVYLAIIHRIDRPASGCLLFCRDQKAAKKLSRQFEHRRVAKTYWAFVEGQVQPDEGTWTDYVFKVHGMAQAIVVDVDYPGAKQAVLHYRVLCSGEAGSWLEIQLETGRTHQIRVQSASRGHPVLGDEQYGSQKSFGPQHAEPRDRAIALHARGLAFTDPVISQSVAVQAPTPGPWHELDVPPLLMREINPPLP